MMSRSPPQSRSARQLVFDEGSTSHFYGRRPAQPNIEDQISPEVSPQHDGWLPGQRLPIDPSPPPPRVMPQVHSSHSAEGHHNRSLRMVESMVQSLQGTINTGFANMKGRLDKLEDRISSIEDKSASQSEDPLPPSTSCHERSKTTEPT